MTIHESPLALEQFTKLRGGRKQIWLRQHRETILAFYNSFGEKETRKTFCLTETTMQSLVTPKANRQRFSQMSKADRALARAEISEVGLLELRKEVKELRQLFDHFQQSVGEQLLTKFFLPLLQSGIKVDKVLDKPEATDPLRIDNIDFSQFKVESKNKR